MNKLNINRRRVTPEFELQETFKWMKRQEIADSKKPVVKTCKRCNSTITKCDHYWYCLDCTNLYKKQGEYALLYGY